MTDAEFQTRVRERMAAVERRVTAACDRAGRRRSDVTVVCVSKRLSPERTALLPGVGLLMLGENRPQTLWKKAEALAGKSVEWHLVGHLQRNKIEKTLPLVALVHSVDSLRLLEALERAAADAGTTCDVLLEVNASGEAAKQGFDPKEVEALLPTIEALQAVRVRGLMTMAAAGDAEEARPAFVSLRKLRDKLRRKIGPSHEFGQLSMGMTNDFEVAIEEGATLVRLGSVYFEGLDA